MAASRTSVVGWRDPCVIVPNSPEYEREGDDLGGVQRLAVMAVTFSRWSRRRAAASASRVLRSRSTARTTQVTGTALQRHFCVSADRAAAISGSAPAGVGSHPDKSSTHFTCTHQ